MSAHYYPWVEKRTILLATVGSQMYGIATDQSDHDRLGVCIPPIEHTVGLVANFEQSVINTPELDETIYGLDKFCRLALKGNPSVLELLYAKPLRMNALGQGLRALAPEFASRKAGGAFLGYVQQQKQRLLGERGQKNVNRQALVEAHGYDTKYAGHILRLGYEGVEYLLTGHITLPLREPQRQRVLDVRQGRVDFNDFLCEAGELERELKDLYTTSPLPEQPNIKAVEVWMTGVLLEWWKDDAVGTFKVYDPIQKAAKGVI